MKYKSIALPAPSKGQGGYGPKKSVPNMALSLQEILERFIRGESVEVGKDGSFDEDGDEDLEKVSNMDLVDRQEYIDALKEKQKAYTRQEKRKKDIEKQRLDKMAVEKLVADKLAAAERVAK